MCVCVCVTRFTPGMTIVALAIRERLVCRRFSVCDDAMNPEAVDEIDAVL